MRHFFSIEWIVALCFVGCSGSSEITDRAKLDREFAQSFGFAPPATVTEISYFSQWGRGFVDGGQSIYMRFTLVPEVAEKITARQFDPLNYNATAGEVPNASWWVPVGVSYRRDKESTGGTEGFQWRETLWIDQSSGYLYWKRENWD